MSQGRLVRLNIPHAPADAAATAEPAASEAESESPAAACGIGGGVEAASQWHKVREQVCLGFCLCLFFSPSLPSSPASLPPPSLPSSL